MLEGTHLERVHRIPHSLRDSLTPWHLPLTDSLTVQVSNLQALLHCQVGRTWSGGALVGGV